MHDSDCVDILVEVAEGLAYLTPIDSHVGPEHPSLEMAVAVHFTEQGASPGTSVSGQLAIGLGEGLPRLLAVNMLGCPVRSAIEPETVRDAAHELVNVLTGNVLPRLYGTVREFSLSTPVAIRALPSAGSHACSVTTEEGLIAMIMTEQP